jgi:hypothetical protein
VRLHATRSGAIAVIGQVVLFEHVAGFANALSNFSDAIALLKGAKHPFKVVHFTNASRQHGYQVLWHVGHLATQLVGRAFHADAFFQILFGSFYLAHVLKLLG